MSVAEEQKGQTTSGTVTSSKGNPALNVKPPHLDTKTEFSRNSIKSVEKQGNDK